MAPGSANGALNRAALPMGGTQKNPPRCRGGLDRRRANDQAGDRAVSIGWFLTWLRYLALAMACLMISRALLLRLMSFFSALPRCWASSLLPIRLVMGFSCWRVMRWCLLYC